MRPQPRVERLRCQRLAACRAFWPPHEPQVKGRTQWSTDRFLERLSALPANRRLLRSAVAARPVARCRSGDQAHGLRQRPPVAVAPRRLVAVPCHGRRQQRQTIHQRLPVVMLRPRQPARGPVAPRLGVGRGRRRQEPAACHRLQARPLPARPARRAALVRAATRRRGGRQQAAGHRLPEIAPPWIPDWHRTACPVPAHRSRRQLPIQEAKQGTRDEGADGGRPRRTLEARPIRYGSRGRPGQRESLPSHGRAASI